MKKSLLTALFTLLLLTLAFATSPVHAEGTLPPDEEKVLNLFTWDSYVDYDTIITPFTEQTGIKVNYANFSSNEEMLAKMEMGNTEYDLILASDYALDTLRQAGLLQPLYKPLLPNYVNIKESFLNQSFDPTNEYVIPYVGGTPLIVYDPAQVDFEITGYEDLWNPSLKGKVVVMDDARNVVGITLKTLGYSFNTTDEAKLEEAKEKLFALRENILVFDYDTPHVVMSSGATTVGYMFTPFVNMLLTERPDFQVVYPKEGMGVGIDGFVISATAPHPESANIFLNFIMQPEIAAETALIQLYRNPNEAADALLPDEYLNNPALNIPSVYTDFEFIQALDPAIESKFQDIWTAFKQQ